MTDFGEFIYWFIYILFNDIFWHFIYELAYINIFLSETDLLSLRDERAQQHCSKMITGRVYIQAILCGRAYCGRHLLFLLLPLHLASNLLISSGNASLSVIWETISISLILGRGTRPRPGSSAQSPSQSDLIHGWTHDSMG